MQVAEGSAAGQGVLLVQRVVQPGALSDNKRNVVTLSEMAAAARAAQQAKAPTRIDLP